MTPRTKRIVWFAALHIGSVLTLLIVSALTFFPALSLGPIVEHYLMGEGKLFAQLPAAHSLLAQMPSVLAILGR